MSEWRNCARDPKGPGKGERRTKTAQERGSNPYVAKKKGKYHRTPKQVPSNQKKTTPRRQGEGGRIDKPKEEEKTPHIWQKQLWTA